MRVTRQLGASEPLPQAQASGTFSSMGCSAGAGAWGSAAATGGGPTLPLQLRHAARAEQLERELPAGRSVPWCPRARPAAWRPAPSESVGATARAVRSLGALQRHPALHFGASLNINTLHNRCRVPEPPTYSVLHIGYAAQLYRFAVTDGKSRMALDSYDLHAKRKYHAGDKTMCDRAPQHRLLCAAAASH